MKKRADGRYCKQMVIGYTDEGKKIIKSFYGKTIKEIEKQATEAKQKLESGIMLCASDNITMAEWAEIWLNTYKLSVAYNTRVMYSNAIYVHIVPVIGTLPLSKIKPVQIQMLLNNILKSGQERTAQIVKQTLEQLFRQAVYEGYIVRDVTQGISSIPRKKNEKRTLTPTELQGIETASLTYKEKLFIDVMRYCGLRRGETLALNTSDIDITGRKLSVSKNLYFEDNSAKIKDPKTKAGRRVIPIIEPLYTELTQYISEMNGAILFPMSNGEYMTKSSYKKFWKGIIKKISVAVGKPVDFTAHICRHTYATNLYCSKIDIKTAQYLLGHSNLTMTLEVYTHIDEEHIQNEIEKLSKFVMAQ